MSNTATQLQMFAALGASLPQFAHMALLTGAEGKLSKRLGAVGVGDLREAGVEAITISAMLARLGTSDPVEPVADMAPLIERFDFAHFGRAPARFSDDELFGLNAKIVHALPYEAVAERLPQQIDAQVWPVVQSNIETVAQAANWLPVLSGEIAIPTFSQEDAEYLGQARHLLPDIDFAADPWQALINTLKAQTGRKGKALFLPLRQALTGLDHGPEMATLLPILGKERALARLGAASGLTPAS